MMEKQNVTPFFVPNQFGLSFVFCVEQLTFPSLIWAKSNIFLATGSVKVGKVKDFAR